MQQPHASVSRGFHSYLDHSKQRWFCSRSGPMRAYVLARVDAIRQWRELMGPTKVFRARYTSPDSIRAQFGLTDTRNTAHGAGRGSVLSARRTWMWAVASRTRCDLFKSFTGFHLNSPQIPLSRHKEKSGSSSRTSARGSGWRRRSHRFDRDEYVTTLRRRFTHFHCKADPRTDSDPRKDHSEPLQLLIRSFTQMTLPREIFQYFACCINMFDDPTKVNVYYLSLVHPVLLSSKTNFSLNKYTACEII